jgi:hypothetical protein
VLISALEKGGEVVFLTRVERARRDPAAGRLYLFDQRHKLLSLAASGENGEAFGGEFFCDRGADVISGADYRRRRISMFQDRTLLLL